MKSLPDRFTEWTAVKSFDREEINGTRSRFHGVLTALTRSIENHENRALQLIITIFKSEKRADPSLYFLQIAEKIARTCVLDN